MIRRPPRSTQGRSSAASDVYKRQAAASPSSRAPGGAGLRKCLSAKQLGLLDPAGPLPVSYTHLRAHETVLELVCRLLLEKKKKTNHVIILTILDTPLRHT